MEVLSLNAGHFLGYDGRLWSYLRHPLRPVLGDGSVELARLREFAEVAADVAPDAILLQEVDCGSIRTATGCQVSRLREELQGPYEHATSPKYRGPLVPRLPILRDLCHGVLHRGGRVRSHYLETGIRSLVQELRLDDVSWFSVHLANTGHDVRRRDVRARQFEELAALVEAVDRYVIVGDFNLHDGPRERDLLDDTIEGEVVSPGPTFPSTAPEYALDLAVVAPTVAVERCEVVDTTVSDHCPIVVEIDA